MTVYFRTKKGKEVIFESNRKPSTRREVEEDSAMERVRQSIAENAEAASRIQTVGMQVKVVLDDGSREITRTRSLPFRLGHGWFVCHLESRHAYDCNRISPV